VFKLVDVCVAVQFSTQFGESFSYWMSRHPRLYRVHQWIDVVERAAPICQLLETSQRVLVTIAIINIIIIIII